MEYIIVSILTLLLCLGIINLFANKRRRVIGKIVYRQSAIHNRIKDHLPNRMFEKPEFNSQSKNHVSKYMVKIIVIEQKAYWVKDNIFYTAETRNGNIIHDTARPVDTSNMSKKDIDKMLFILDNLGRGNDDSSSSRN